MELAFAVYGRGNVATTAPAVSKRAATKPSREDVLKVM
jgi:hypothetical protein